MRHEKLGLTKLLCNIFHVRNRHQKINAKNKGRFVYGCCTHATSPLLWPSILRTFLVLCRSDGPYQNDRRCQQIAMVPSDNGFVCRQIFSIRPEAFLFQFKPSFLEVPKCCVNGHLYTIHLHKVKVSEFLRSWTKLDSASHLSNSTWNFGDDHFPRTTLLLPLFNAT